MAADKHHADLSAWPIDAYGDVTIKFGQVTLTFDKAGRSGRMLINRSIRFGGGIRRRFMSVAARRYANEVIQDDFTSMLLC